MTALVLGLPGGWSGYRSSGPAALRRQPCGGHGQGRRTRHPRVQEEIKAPRASTPRRAAEPEDLSKPRRRRIVTPEPRKES